MFLSQQSISIYLSTSVPLSLSLSLKNKEPSGEDKKQRVQTRTGLSEGRNSRAWREIQLEKIVLVVFRLSETVLGGCFG